MKVNEKKHIRKKCDGKYGELKGGKEKNWEAQKKKIHEKGRKGMHIFFVTHNVYSFGCMCTGDTERMREKLL